MTTVTDNAGIVLKGQLAELREREIRLLHDIADYLGNYGAEGAEDKKRLLETAADLHDMFLMVVIIGEFNAGKSTFVNALLGDPLLPMGITPTTDAIELVRYAPTTTRYPDQRDGAIHEWGHPNTGIPGVVIVDTPGTGSVFQKHEQIAKSFLHRSDLVIFLISAKRAFAETERLYLELAKGYGKKIVIVINQSDLLDSKEQNEVQGFVLRQAEPLLGLRPPIFMVSAKKTLQAEKSSGGLFNALRGGDRGEREDYGMNDIRAYLRQTFEQVPPAKQKLLTQIEFLRTIATKRRESIQVKLSLIGTDTNAAEDLKREIDQQANGLDKQLAGTLKELHTVFEGIRLRGARFIEKHINVIRALRDRGIDKDALRDEFNRDVLGNALNQVSTVSDHYVNSVIDGGRAYWRSVIERLNKMEILLREESGSMDAATYADQRAALQEAMTMADVQMKGYTDHLIVEQLQTEFNSNTRNFAYSAVGGVVGVLVTALSALTPGLVGLAHFGIVFGPAALAVGGVGALVFWRKATSDAQRRLNSSIQELEDSYKTSLVQLTTRERSRLVQYGQQILAPVFSQLQALAARYKDQQGQLDTFMDRAKGIETEINAVKM